MRINEAKDIFAEVTQIECPVCGTKMGFLCDAVDVWVHDERIRYAMIEDDRYLYVAAVKRIDLAVYKPNLGDRYAAVAQSAVRFTELFNAFDKDVTKSQFERNGEIESRSSQRSLYLVLSATIKELTRDFELFAEAYEKEDVPYEERRKYNELTRQVNILRKNYDLFEAAMRETMPTVSEEDNFSVELRKVFDNFRHDYLRFSLEYGLLMNTLLGQNLAQTFELFSQAFDDAAEVTTS